MSLGDLNDKSEEVAFRKFKLRIDEIQGRNCLTNFHAMSLTSDKLKSMVRKWQSLIEAHTDVKTTDGYLIRVFCIAFTKRRSNQLKKTSYAQSAQVKQIRKKMFDIISKEVTSCELKDVVAKLVPDFIGKEIEKQCSSIYPLQNVCVRKVKLLKTPKYDVQKLLEMYQADVSATADEGQKVERSEGWVEPVPSETV